MGLINNDDEKFEEEEGNININTACLKCSYIYDVLTNYWREQNDIGLRNYIINYHNTYYDDDISTKVDLHPDIIEIFDFLAAMSDYHLKGKSLDEALDLERLTGTFYEGDIRRFFRDALEYNPRSTMDRYDPRQENYPIRNCTGNTAINYALNLTPENKYAYIPYKWNLVLENLRPLTIQKSSWPKISLMPLKKYTTILYHKINKFLKDT